mmetsp:Transcript_96884/g.172453  ORF Transcript_96884/g.172453 Transcript_96884/m.172453 type:complete len:171 (-) Transcript_96884:186-698(-)|eukprot:CAMPEP_0197640884 /NCGR_PEP_ID=MMETSP1338-20131121/15017_1 /TAXON_ID=43686 ORGANISM="Pelagodinium beii, Strain RCC1491" /NCGR_SAMPLE_ID=MMETSP1338 /ASSEMBLY_ACC=CAM_ASM_000754 /LENGTH=170 /DNA_ID=CAMNT_0043213767 /DNA_START=41 /DNA_END=553 /DNA_ORIENTATION=-
MAAAMVADDNASVSSRTSKYSVLSFMSKPSRISSYLNTAMHSGSTRKPKLNTDIMEVGDTVDTLTAVTIRQEENLESAVVGTLPSWQTVTILDFGEARRMKIETASGLQGWISFKTKMHQPLVCKRAKCSSTPTPTAPWAQRKSTGEVGTGEDSCCKDRKVRNTAVLPIS